MTHKTEDLIAGLVADLTPIAPLRKRGGMALAVLALGGGTTGMLQKKSREMLSAPRQQGN